MLHPVNVSIPFTSTIKLIPLGCVHWPLTNRPLLNEWIEKLKEPNTYGLLVGDTFEFERTTARRYLRAYVGDDNSFNEIDKAVNQEVLRLAKKLEPVRDKILGAIRGNHYHVFYGMGGINSEQLLCQQLGIRYLGPAGAVRLDLREPSNNDHVRDHLVLWAHHHGGSRGTTPAGDVSGLMKQGQKLRADIYMIGHTHDCYGRIEMERVISRSTPPTVFEEDRAYVRVGCLRENVTRKPDAQLPDEVDYADEAGYTPRRNGFVELTIEYKRKSARGLRNRRISVKF